MGEIDAGHHRLERTTDEFVDLRFAQHDADAFVGETTIAFEFAIER